MLCPVYALRRTTLAGPLRQLPLSLPFACNVWPVADTSCRQFLSLPTELRPQRNHRLSGSIPAEEQLHLMHVLLIAQLHHVLLQLLRQPPSGRAAERRVSQLMQHLADVCSFHADVAVTRFDERCMRHQRLKVRRPRVQVRVQPEKVTGGTVEHHGGTGGGRSGRWPRRPDCDGAGAKVVHAALVNRNADAERRQDDVGWCMIVCLVHLRLPL
jgi:hypothetical protein